MIRDRLRSIHAQLVGCRVYLPAIVVAGPDILNALGGFDWSPLLPPGLAAKVGAGLALARLVLAPIIANARQSGGKEPQ